MRKIGFTLVELLAVIAILAILVIIAIPNIISMYNDAKKNSFGNEVNTIISTARRQYLLDGGVAQTYSNAKSASKKLDLQGGKKIKYSITLNSAGEVINLQVTNGTYQYNKNETIETALIGDIKKVSELNDAEILVIDDTNENSSNYIYIADRTIISIGSMIPQAAITYDNYEDLINSSEYPFFIRHKIINERVAESDVGFIKEGVLHYLKGNDVSAFNDNVSTLNQAFGESNCISNNIMAYSTNKIFSLLGIPKVYAAAEISSLDYVCHASNISAAADADGSVDAFYDGWHCLVMANGNSKCRLDGEQ